MNYFIQPLGIALVDGVLAHDTDHGSCSQSNPTGADHPLPLAPPQHSGLRRVFGPGLHTGLVVLSALGLGELAQSRLSLGRSSRLVLSRPRRGFPAGHVGTAVSVRVRIMSTSKRK
jgi:hypothetical protein